jgi:hypothetical protein
MAFLRLLRLGGRAKHKEDGAWSNANDFFAHRISLTLTLSQRAREKRALDSKIETLSGAESKHRQVILNSGFKSKLEPET